MDLEFVFKILWMVGAFCLGLFGFFYTEEFNEGNAKRFEWLYKKTGFTLFKLQAEQTRRPLQYYVTKLVSLFFFSFPALVYLNLIEF